jgi:GNAT superfamily N-acetyltransferase
VNLATDALKAKWQVEALSKEHQRQDFNCGDLELNGYLQRYVHQDSKRSLTRAFVLIQTDVHGTRPKDPATKGYYTLSATHIQREKFPTEQAKKLPRYPIPAVLLGRLAVDHQLQGKGLGAFLLVDALKRVARASATIGVYAVMVDASSDRAAQYYQDFGFLTLKDQPRTLFLPMDTVLQIS